MFATEVMVPDWLVPGLILIGITGILTVFVRAVFHSFREWLKDWFEDIQKEIKPNGGNTNQLGDLVVRHGQALDRVEEGIKGLYPRIDAIEEEQTRVRTELTAVAACSVSHGENCPLNK